MEKKILIILLCGLLAVWPCIPALATEEETTAEWNIFEDVETVARQTVTSIEQGTEIISKYIAMTTEYTGDIFANLVNEAVNLWQTSGVAMTLEYITNGGALDYIVDIGELGALISEYINSNYSESEGDTNNSKVDINGATWVYMSAGSTGTFNNVTLTNTSSDGIYWTIANNYMIVCSYITSESGSFSFSPSVTTYNEDYTGNSYLYGLKYYWGWNTDLLWSYVGGDQYSNYRDAPRAFYGYTPPTSDSATSTPIQYITNDGLGTVNWSNVTVDEADTYNNIENVYNYITNTGQQLDEASVDQMAAEGATLANIDYSVPNVNYDYSFISVAFACLPDEFKGIILLGIVLLVCSILFGFGHGGVK